MPTDPIHLCRLTANTENIARVQAVLEATPRYSIAISGKAAPADAGESVFTSRPPGIIEKDKWVLGVMRQDEMIGVVDLISGYPRPEIVYIGLLTIQETEQRQGIGRTAWSKIEALARTWHGCECFRLSVVRMNEGAIRFWTTLGFAPAVGQEVPYRNGSVSSVAVVFEKILK